MKLINENSKYNKDKPFVIFLDNIIMGVIIKEDQYYFYKSSNSTSSSRKLKTLIDILHNQNYKIYEQ